jgi:hypothetical protein
MSKQEVSSIGLAVPPDAQGRQQDDAMSPHNPVEIRQAMSGAQSDPKDSFVSGPQMQPPVGGPPGQYLLQPTATQEQIMKRDEILRPIFGEVGDLYNGENSYSFSLYDYVGKRDSAIGLQISPAL